MGTQTSRLKLLKPDVTDNVNVLSQLNANYDSIDAAIGTFICTSTTHPTGTNRFQGQIIFETDTLRSYIWTGGGWTRIQTDQDFGTVKRDTDDLTTFTNTTTMTNDTQLFVVLGAGNIYTVDTTIHVSGPTAADFKMNWTFSGTLNYSARSVFGPHASVADDTNMTAIINYASALATAIPYGTDGGHVSVIRESLYLDVNTAGVLQLMGAQVTANVSTTAMTKSSRFNWNRVQ